MEVRTSARSLGDGTRVLTVVGDIDLHTAPTFQQSLSAVMGDSEGRVIVDLTECDYLDSTALHVIVQARRELNGRADTLRLVVPAPSMLRIFEVTGLAATLAIYPSLAAAANGGADDG
jgi:anti-sigma B factor antagonist